MTTVLDLSSRDCTTPGCTGEAVRNVAGLPFCQACLEAEPHRVLKAIAQRAEMRRQAALADDRRARARTDELRVRREQRDRDEQHARKLAASAMVTPKQLDGRIRAVLTLQRLLTQAERRGDDVLAAGLRAAVDAVAAELMTGHRRRVA